MRSLLFACLGWCVLAAPLAADDSPFVDLSKIDRSIAKEPKYAHEPHYALIVFGPRAAHRAWLVMDGDDVLYIDRNGNGDLSEPDERIEPDPDDNLRLGDAERSPYLRMNIFRIGTVAGVELKFNFWVRKKGFVSDDERYRRIMREREQNNWENGTLWRVAGNRSHAQNPVVLTRAPADAQITHLDGPLTFGLKWHERQKLQPWPKETTFDLHIGTPMLPPRNCPRSFFAPLTEAEIPRDRHAVARFEFPSAFSGGETIVREIVLDQRCCGDTIYARLVIPPESAEGTANVTITYPTWDERVVHPATFEVPIGGKRDSSDSEVSFVMFHDPGRNVGLNEALTALRVSGLTVQKQVNSSVELLQIPVSEEKWIVITLNRTPEALETARVLAERSRFGKTLARCESRLEITFHPGSVIDDDPALVAQIQTALQKETQGILYTTWDQRFAGGN
ncbi:MAG: hypothetical protein ACT4QC_03260 [Planctomycetaceae bacterium]